MRQRISIRAWLPIACVTLAICGTSNTAFSRETPTRDGPGQTKVDSAKPSEAHDELIDDLLGGLNSDLHDRVAQLMKRSEERLRSADTGEDTQAIQKKILEGIDELLDEMAKGPKPPGKSSGTSGQMAQPKASSGNATSRSASSPASGQHAKSGNAQAVNSKPAPTSQSSGESFVSTAEPFMKIAPRMRQAVIEGAGETACEKYRGLISDYYRRVATQAQADRQP